MHLTNLEAGRQALLAEKAKMAAEQAEAEQKNKQLLLRLQLAGDSGAGLQEGSPCSPLGEPQGAQDLPAEALESPGGRAAALAQELEDLKGMLFECVPAT